MVLKLLQQLVVVASVVAVVCHWNLLGLLLLTIAAATVERIMVPVNGDD